MNVLVDYIITTLNDLPTITKAYSPQLPVEASDFTCGVQVISAGNIDNKLKSSHAGREVFINITLRGSKDDGATLVAVDEIFNALNNVSTPSGISSIVCDSPIFGGETQKNTNVYVVRLTAII